MVRDFVVDVTDADLDAYEEERLGRLEALAESAPAGVAFDWTPLDLNEDGSLATRLPAPKQGDRGVTLSRGDWKR